MQCDRVKENLKFHTLKTFIKEKLLWFTFYDFRLQPSQITSRHKGSSYMAIIFLYSYIQLIGFVILKKL